jgi:hypothetical protein
MDYRKERGFVVDLLSDKATIQHCALFVDL